MLIVCYSLLLAIKLQLCREECCGVLRVPLRRNYVSDIRTLKTKKTKTYFFKNLGFAAMYRL